jgi:hypothetical protein
LIAAVEERRCSKCGEVLSVRRSYSVPSGEPTVSRYCYPCENDDLIRLARSAGK